jgi:hypothetical protein
MQEQERKPIIWHNVRNLRDLDAIEPVCRDTHYDGWSKPGRVDKKGNYILIVTVGKPIPPHEPQFAISCTTEELMLDAVAMLKKHTNGRTPRQHGEYRSAPPRVEATPSRALPTADQINAKWSELERQGHADAMGEVCSHFGITFPQCSSILSAAADLPKVREILVNANNVDTIIFLSGGEKVEVKVSEILETFHPKGGE